MSETEWALVYIETMINRWVSYQFAKDTFLAGDNDFTSDPVQAAEDEMSYWGE